jgi:tRNA-(ms[2]io[6]A)-hydroxylase
MSGPVGELFESLHAAEARHYRTYLELARRAAERAGLDTRARMDEFAALEAELITSRDELFRFHSGMPATLPTTRDLSARAT